MAHLYLVFHSKTATARFFAALRMTALRRSDSTGPDDCEARVQECSKAQIRRRSCAREAQRGRSGSFAEDIDEALADGVEYAIMIRGDALEFNQALASILETSDCLNPQRTAICESAKNIVCSLILSHEETPRTKTGATRERCKLNHGPTIERAAKKRQYRDSYILGIEESPDNDRVTRPKRTDKVAVSQRVCGGLWKTFRYWHRRRQRKSFPHFPQGARNLRASTAFTAEEFASIPRNRTYNSYVAALSLGPFEEFWGELP